MADKPKTVWWIIGAFLVLYLFVPSFKGTIDNVLAGILPSGTDGGAGDGGTGGATPPIEFCPYDGATMTIGPIQKMYAPSTSVANEWARVYVKGTDKGLKQDSSTMTVTYKDDVELYYGENSSTYYASKQKFTVPCAAAFSTADEGLRSNNEFKLYQQDASTYLNLKCFDEDDGLLNGGMGGSAGGCEDISAGDLITISCSVQGNYEDAYSPYGDLLFTLKYNNTAYDEHDLAAQTSGWSFSSGIATPTFRSSGASTAGYDLKTFKLSPGIISNQKVDFTWTLDVDDTLDPAKSNISIWIDDEDFFRNTDSGKMEYGPEDNDDTNVGLTTAKLRNMSICA